MNDSAKVSNSKPLDAAPPETDLRDADPWDETAMDNDALVYCFAAVAIAAEGHLGDIESRQAKRFHSVSAELLRRLTRPDELREKVMAAIDELGREPDPHCRICGGTGEDLRRTIDGYPSGRACDCGVIYMTPDRIKAAAALGSDHAD
jgi:hypothetical protein